jgi:uncharacterized protein (DUF1800 family)
MRADTPSSRTRASSLARTIAASVLVSTLAACGGGGSSGSEPLPPIVPSTDVPPDAAAAARFLTRATFGATRADIDLLLANGYTGWLDWQAIVPVSLERPALEEMNDDDHDQSHRLMLWWKNAVTKPDQLRQRMAFALSQILVISQESDLYGDPIGMAEYYDILSRNALGNYRDVLQEVTLSPQMGVYLSTLRNQKADFDDNIRPDENYAREVMQLFTVGLYELELDGSLRLDGDGAPIPTYDQSVVEDMARVFTGWTYAGSEHWWSNDPNYLPMENWADYHDFGSKTVIGGTLIPAGLTAAEDLSAALDALFAHPNVGPFVSRQLILRLVTSNPSPAYIARVASVFDDDGTGARGNLFAVAKAILLDDEALTGHTTSPTTFGKLKEPLLRQTAVWRAFEARNDHGTFPDLWPEGYYGQGPLRAPSVFNFYSPFFQPPGEMSDAGLYGPEFQITTHTFITSTTNHLLALTLWWHDRNDDLDDQDVRIRLAHERTLAADPEALVDHLDLVLMSGSMSDDMRAIVLDLANDIPIDDDEGQSRVLETIFAIVTSPECAVQR